MVVEHDAVDEVDVPGAEREGDAGGRRPVVGCSREAEDWIDARLSECTTTTMSGTQVDNTLQFPNRRRPPVRVPRIPYLHHMIIRTPIERRYPIVHLRPRVHVIHTVQTVPNPLAVEDHGTARRFLLPHTPVREDPDRPIPMVHEPLSDVVRYTVRIAGSLRKESNKKGRNIMRPSSSYLAIESFPRPAWWAFFGECGHTFMKVRLGCHAVYKTARMLDCCGSIDMQV